MRLISHAPLRRYVEVAGKCFALASLAILSVGSGAPALDYEAGQVWEYHTRSSDNGSLLKIQMVETPSEFAKGRAIYHVSIVGLDFGGLPMSGELQHAPFSKAALDSSVTRLSSSQAVFPDPSAGIAEWRAARGGVFTVSVAEAVDFVEQTIRQQVTAQPTVG